MTTLIQVKLLSPVVAKHDFKDSVAAEKGGEGAEAGITKIETTPEGDGNA